MSLISENRLLNYFILITTYLLGYIIVAFRVRIHLRSILVKLAHEHGLQDVSLLTKHLHILPDFHGNRSPLANPKMKGMIVGLTINSSEENLALHYLATLQALSVRLLLIELFKFL